MSEIVTIIDDEHIVNLVGQGLDFSTPGGGGGGPVDASAVSYTPGGTGAVLSDVQTKLRTIISVWLTGGTLGSSYTLTVKVTTSNGRIDEFGITIYIEI